VDQFVGARSFNGAKEADVEEEHSQLRPCSWPQLRKVVVIELNIIAEEAEHPNPSEEATDLASYHWNSEALVIHEHLLGLAGNIPLV